MDYYNSMLTKLIKAASSKGFDVKTNDEDQSVILSGKGNEAYFTTIKKAIFYLDESDKSDNLVVEDDAGVVNQKTDEVTVKRRGRPRKVDNDRSIII